MAKKVPLRRCVGCGEMKGKKDMIRVLKTAEDQICLDTTGKKKPGGAHIFVRAGSAFALPGRTKDGAFLQDAHSRPGI